MFTKAAAFFALLLLAPTTVVSVDELVSKRDSLNEKVVEVTAVVKEFSARTSKKGNKYTLFKLTGKKQTVSVWLGGHLDKIVPAPKDGDTLKVVGIFEKEKKVGTRTYLNEIDASVRKDKPYGVTVVKRK
jgi:hypothetical protein